mmetsp:Transcript_48456/g.112271  ORF Transcript_48456/g.112271 Transcript_48456/m.112271 type:complete len:183 (-) Transcript_48456:236-784(-)
MLWVTARLADGSVHAGALHSKDPRSGNLLLLKPSEQAADDCCVVPIFLMRDAILDVQYHGKHESASHSTDARLEPMNKLRGALHEAPNVQASLHRRQAICELLHRQRVPYQLLSSTPPAASPTDSSGISDVGDDAAAQLTILGCLRAWPPFVGDSCQCENELVLGRYLHLLSQVDAILAGVP